ncbi:hypothetical protein Y032_0002g578 [Ancylostoma ceylanicum]|nr:hypothetical protein Y032_0002g578 [Ancylostoma ceylanicum]
MSCRTRFLNFYTSINCSTHPIDRLLQRFGNSNQMSWQLVASASTPHIRLRGTISGLNKPNSPRIELLECLRVERQSRLPLPLPLHPRGAGEATPNIHSASPRDVDDAAAGVAIVIDVSSCDCNMATEDVEMEDVSVDQTPFPTVHLLQMVKDAQQQHGLRHADYNRYRSYCRSKLNRVRHALKFINTHKCVRRHKAKFVKRPMNELDFADERYRRNIELLSFLKQIICRETQRRIHFFSAYAPQTGCTDQAKDEFWALIDEKTAAVPPEDTVIIAGDLNGHVGATKDGYRCQGGCGYGVRNSDGERILDYAESHNLVIANTRLRKRPSHLVSFYSGSNMTQIDYVLVRCRDQELVTDAKVVPYEAIAAQHRPLICTMKITPPKQKYDERCGPSRIKWWRLKEKEDAVISRISLPPVTTVEETWQHATRMIAEVARSELGVTKANRRKIDKQTWLWTDQVKQIVREKKRLYHVYLRSKTAENWSKYREARRTAKKAVATAKAAHYEVINKELDTRDGERLVYRLAKSRKRQAEDVEKFHGINDEHGQLLMDYGKVRERWHDYFEKISTEEFTHLPILQLPPTQGPVQPITVEETEAALKQMKSGKATRPDDVAVIVEKGVPLDWQRSTTIPIWKGKGIPADCSDYRPIRLLFHSMNVFEHVLDRHIRDIVSLLTNQYGFVAKRSTTDAIHAVRLLIEKHREKQKALHIAFLDLEKAFDRVPHELIWYALRKHAVPEELVEWVRILYTRPRCQVQAPAGTSAEFPITVGVHRGSALSPLLFILVMDAVTRDLQKPALWTLLYANDVVIAAEDKYELERQTQACTDRLAQFGLRLNVTKTEYLTTDVNQIGTISVGGTDLPRTEAFKYLGSTVSFDGCFSHEVTARINGTWLKLR